MKSLLLFLLSITIASAQHQKLDAPLNESGRTLTFHLYHFDTLKNPVHLHTKPKDVTSVVRSSSHLVAVTLGTPPPKLAFNLAAKHGILKINTGNKTGFAIGPRLFSTKQQSPQLDAKNHARRTFLLHNGANLWAIGYAPSISQKQLAKALQHISKNGSIRYTSAYQINAGNSSGLWVSKGNYHPFYLKELQSPACVLSVRIR